MLGLLLILLHACSPALAAPGEEAAGALGEPVDHTPSPSARIDAAVSLYISGDLPQARDELIRLVNDPNIDPDSLREARIWLGEVEYVSGERDAAKSSFRTVLIYDPSYRMDPFLHPPEVVAFFEATRAELERSGSAQQLSPTRPPLPRTLAFMIPGGPMVNNGRPLLGATTFVTVSALGAATIPMRLWMKARDERPDVRIIYPANEEVSQQVRAMRALQLTTGTAALAVWMGTAFVGTMSHGRTSALSLGQDRPAQMQLSLTPQGAVFVLRF